MNREIGIKPVDSNDRNCNAINYLLRKILNTCCPLLSHLFLPFASLSSSLNHFLKCFLVDNVHRNMIECCCMIISYLIFHFDMFFCKKKNQIFSRHLLHWFSILVRKEEDVKQVKETKTNTRLMIDDLGMKIDPIGMGKSEEWGIAWKRIKLEVRNLLIQILE